MNTVEIISKLTITLSLINSNKDFDFVGWVIKTPWLFYFRSVKFHYVKETHDINSLLTLVKIALASQHKKQPNKSLSRFVDNWPLSHGGHFESQENKKLCFCPSSLALEERLDVQNLLFQHCVIKVYWKQRLGLESARAPLCKWVTRTHYTCVSKTFATSPNKQK